MCQDYVGNNCPKPKTLQTDFQDLYCTVVLVDIILFEGVYLLKEA